MVKTSPDMRTVDAVARRLRVLRKALGLQQAQIADRADIKRNAYNQYDKGGRALTLAPALKLCETFGVTLDWLFRGDLTGLPHGLAVDITRIAADPEEFRRVRRKQRKAPKLSKISA